MTGCEDPAFAALDARIRTHLTRAAEDYASSVDLRTQLAAILETRTQNEEDDIAAAQS